MWGSSQFATGLSVARHRLEVQTLNVGPSGGSGLGRLEQSGGEVAVSGTAGLWAGQMLLSGGSMSAGTLQMSANGTVPVLFSQTGGTLAVRELRLDARGTADASFELCSGTTHGNVVSIGSGLAGGGAHLLVSGSNAMLQVDAPTPADTALLVGEQSRGWLEVTAGGRVETAVLSAGLAPTAPATLGISGTGSRLVVTQVLTLGVSSSNAVLTVGSGGQLTAGTVIVGYVPLVQQGAATHSVTVTGIGSVLNANATFIGRAGTGSLLVDDNARANIGSMVIGQLAGSRGSVSVTGGARLDVSGALQVGAAGQGQLTIGTVSTVTAATTAIGSDGRLTLNYGTLRTGTLSVASGGQFDWRGGALEFGTSPTSNTTLPFSMTVPPGGTLETAGTLTIAPNTTLTMAGGQVMASKLVLNGGEIAGTQALDLLRVDLFTGSGTVATQVRSINPASTIRATGTLLLGSAIHSTGYQMAGTLDVGSQSVLLLDSGLAELGVSTLISGGGRLASFNGVTVPANGSLVASSGTARVEGSLVNLGSIDARNGTLRLMDEVSGAGVYQGRLWFAGMLRPAGGQFAGADVSVETSGKLYLTLNSPSEGSFDQMLGLHSLDMRGTLHLLFGNGSAPFVSGGRLQLLQFDSFSGVLDAAHIIVTGFDRDRLDFSRLAVDGTLGISPLPEPASWVLWLMGATAMGHVVRRRRR